MRSGGFPIRWVSVESIHLTLKFLGEVDVSLESQVIAAMESAVMGYRGFALSLSGFGAFPNTRRPRVVWLGCEPVTALELVQHRVEEEMSAIGFPLEGRPFHPHFTLGRARREARITNWHGFDGILRQTTFTGVVAVDTIDLMQSQLTRAGARYYKRYEAGLSGL
jgi:2'-5' RNA ligase